MLAIKASSKINFFIWTLHLSSMVCNLTATRQATGMDDPPSKPCPFYADLDKKCTSVFSKGYHFGFIRLDLKTKSEAGIQFTTNLVATSGKFIGSLASKYAIGEKGISFTEKWNTDNVIASDVTFSNIKETGLNVTLEGSLATQSGVRSGKLKTSYAKPSFAFNTNTDLQISGPILDAALVIGKAPWFLGVQAQLDSREVKVSKHSVALGFQTNDVELMTKIENGKEFGGCIYQKIKENIDCGVAAKWISDSSNTMFGIGLAWNFAKDMSLHAKINNKALFGFGHRQVLRPGITMTLSLAIDGQSLSNGQHKVGFALELEP